MKTQEKEQLKKLTVGQLEAELTKRRRNLGEAKLKLGLGQLKDTSLIRRLRNEITIIETFSNEKKLLERLKLGRKND